ncbi:hemolysin family protein [Accumulibacter sp.]|uniref:hemolysin family protein n=1 Tax=Accumulibacter sp. TaxID=2053492 RepID=UPI0025E7A6C8|nr:hemolysin family protein [Accumulibacter sp.]MCM8612858.1 hemolysin family protein [Accumulibacter sp.]MCM8636794.1 hemolysin family protein [Accumulibacter sp.]MCM8641960.1 hemolysin family protein [Accumulibacter sp.]
MDLILQLLVILVFLLLKGFFSGSELAMVNSDKIHLRHEARMGNQGAKLVLNLFRTPDVMLGTTLVGTNIATVTITTLGTLIFVRLFGDAGDLVSVLVFTPFLLIFGEIVPKSIFQQKADTIVTRIIYGLRFFSYVFYPVIFVFSRVARFAARLFGGASSASSGFISKDELRVLIDLSETASDSAATSKQRIRRIFRFADTTVGEVMTPLAEVIGFNETREMAEAVRRVWSSGFNRLPVFRGNITNVTGVMTLSTWDLLLPDIEQRPVSDFVKPALYLSPRQSLDQVLPLLRSRSDHMAVVVDEFGSAIGILTMEDIFEEVVGPVDSGFDFDGMKTRRISIEAISDDAHLISGRAPISELNDSLKLGLPVGDAHTIAGFLINRLRRIPQVGDTVVEQTYRYTVIEADARTATKVRAERI